MSMPMDQDSHGIEKRQTQVLDLIPIGEFAKTTHGVRGMVWAYNNSLLLVEDFGYDGQGFGVYFQVATEGKNRKQYLKSRKTIGYPVPEDVGTPLDRPYGNDPEKPDWVVLRMPADIRVQDIKWMTVWCDAFGLSFGEVDFPEFA